MLLSAHNRHVRGKDVLCARPQQFNYVRKQNFFTFTLPPGAAPLFYRHPNVQNTILPNKVLWSALFLLPGSKYQEKLTVSVLSLIHI